MYDHEPEGGTVHKADTGLPDITATLDGDSPECPTCRHTAITTPTRNLGIRGLLGLRPRPAECPVPEYDMSGLSAMPCGCTHPSHGS